jgi:hypothetical protein
VSIGVTESATLFVDRHIGVLHGSDWKFGRGDCEIARCEVPRNFVDRGDHKSGDVTADLGTSGLGS